MSSQNTDRSPRIQANESTRVQRTSHSSGQFLMTVEVGPLWMNSGHSSPGFDSVSPRLLCPEVSIEFMQVTTDAVNLLMHGRRPAAATRHISRCHATTPDWDVSCFCFPPKPGGGVSYHRRRFSTPLPAPLSFMASIHPESSTLTPKNAISHSTLDCSWRSVRLLSLIETAGPRAF